MNVEDEIVEIKEDVARIRERSHSFANVLMRIENKLDQLELRYVTKETLKTMEQRLDRMQLTLSTVGIGVIITVIKMIVTGLK